MFFLISSFHMFYPFYIVLIRNVGLYNIYLTTLQLKILTNALNGIDQCNSIFFTYFKVLVISIIL